MFSFGGSIALFPVRQDPTQERLAPPYPTAISFPNIDAFLEASQSWDRLSAPDLFYHYSRIRKLSDVSARHLELLNVSLRQSNVKCNIEGLFPTNDTAKTFLPQPETATEHTEAPSEPRVLYNGRPFPSYADYLMRTNELECDQEDAYRTLSRATHDGRPPVRLAHLRKFWEALINMGNYWDTSRDTYFSTRVIDENLELQDDPIEDDETVKEDEPRKRSKPLSREEKNSSPKLSISASGKALDQFDATSAPRESGVPASERVSPAGTYCGYRLGNGANMPESYRIDAVKAFVEAAVWPFGFTVGGHRRLPVLEIKSLLVPIKLSGIVWRPPKEREKARAGNLQGPVLGISCRSETGFASGEADPILDILRELGALLCLAQERARQGGEELKPGAGKWWTTEPRWGGGLGGEMGEALAADKDDDVKLSPGNDPPTEADSKRRPTKRDNSAKRKQAIVNAWKTLRVGVGFWDPKIEYCAVGKPKDSLWDEVYLVSSLNHHLSVVRLTVHEHYLTFLRTGQLPDVVTSSTWSTPFLSRSAWFDLFDPEQRLEAFKLLWGIAGYLARSQ